jgi:hypothetical protein
LIVALIMACYQAWKARDVSEDFSESKYIGVGVFMWIELPVVGVPVAVIVRDSDSWAYYIVLVGLVFTMCISMLIVVFLPIAVHFRANPQGRSDHVRVSGITRGLTPAQPRLLSTEESHGGSGAHGELSGPLMRTVVSKVEN